MTVIRNPPTRLQTSRKHYDKMENDMSSNKNRKGGGSCRGRKPVRSNGMKPYYYDIKDYPDPTDPSHPYDGIYYFGGDPDGPVRMSDFVRQDGVFFDDWLRSLGKKGDVFLDHTYKSLDTMVNAWTRYRSGRLEDAVYDPRYNVFYVAHTGDMARAVEQAIRNPGKGVGIAAYSDPSVTGIQTIKKVKGKEDLPPGAYFQNEYQGDINNRYFRDVTVPSTDVFYKVEFRPANEYHDLGVYSEKQLYAQGVISDNGRVPHARSGSESIRTPAGEYRLKRVNSPPKVKGEYPRTIRYGQASSEEYADMMERYGRKAEDDSWSSDWKGRTDKETPVDLSFIPSRNRKPRKGKTINSRACGDKCDKPKGKRR